MATGTMTIYQEAEAVILIEGATSTAMLGDRHKELRLLIHPDRFGADEKWAKRAEAATYKLDSLFSTKKPVSAVRIGNWVVSEPLTKGDIGDLYRAESKGISGVLKIAQTPRDNDLITNERTVLKKIHENKNHFGNYVPRLLDGFTASGRAANVITLADGFIPLTEISSLVKLDFRHVVWMMNRALSALGFIHKQGVVHGAITPDHLLYCPADHNLCLVDWCYASTGSPIKAVVKKYRDLYPPEVLRKQTPGYSVDLFMAASVLRQVAEVPKSFKPLFDLCMVQSPASRPAGAWEFQDRWKNTAEREYGPARFVPLVLPIN